MMSSDGRPPNLSAGSLNSNFYGEHHKIIAHIAVHKSHFKTFKTERGAKAWLARWEKKP